MNGENVFYVYEHWRPDKNVCFYVGKGKNKRAWDLKNMRNRYHKAVTSKLISMGLAVDVRIIAKDLSSQTAISMEIDRISLYGIENLTNMTYGGDGLSNPTPALRQKMSASQKKRIKDNPDELIKMSIQRKGRKVSEETRKKLSITSKGRKHSSETIEKFKIIARKRGVSEATRAAHKKALTGKKRAPFKESTIIKMREAAKLREEKKRLQRIEAA